MLFESSSSRIFGFEKLNTTFSLYFLVAPFSENPRAKAFTISAIEKISKHCQILRNPQKNTQKLRYFDTGYLRFYGLRLKLSRSLVLMGSIIAPNGDFGSFLLLEIQMFKLLTKKMLRILSRNDPKSPFGAIIEPISTIERLSFSLKP